MFTALNLIRKLIRRMFAISCVWYLMNGNRNKTDKMRETVGLHTFRGVVKNEGGFVFLYYSGKFDDRVMMAGDIKYSRLCEKNTRKYRISSK